MAKSSVFAIRGGGFEPRQFCYKKITSLSSLPIELIKEKKLSQNIFREISVAKHLYRGTSDAKYLSREQVSGNKCRRAQSCGTTVRMPFLYIYITILMTVLNNKVSPPFQRDWKNYWKKFCEKNIHENNMNTYGSLFYREENELTEFIPLISVNYH